MGKKKIKNPGISFRVNQPRLSIAMTPGKKNAGIYGRCLCGTAGGFLKREMTIIKSCNVSAPEMDPSVVAIW